MSHEGLGFQNEQMQTSHLFSRFSTKPFIIHLDRQDESMDLILLLVKIIVISTTVVLGIIAVVTCHNARLPIDSEDWERSGL